jgi:MarR family 2-MHQ and catechol resistance regulon transcriptional repressor
MGTHFKGPAAVVRALDAFVKLARCATTIGARMELQLRERGFTENQFGVLEALLHVGPLAQCDLGRKLLTSRPNVTLVVDQLEERGLVRRVRSIRDRRSIAVHLTPEGRRLIEKEFPPHAAAITEAFSPLSAAEQVELGRLCRKLGRGVAVKKSSDLDLSPARESTKR